METQASTIASGATIEPTIQVTRPVYSKRGDTKINAIDTRTAPIATFASCEARVEAGAAEGGSQPGT
jgi:hypothetical protein